MASINCLTAIADDKSFRSHFIRVDEHERPTVAYDQFSDEIPVISLAGMDDEDGGRRAEICKQIVGACEDWGIFQIVDHGLDSKLISEMQRLSRDFFAFPPQDKLRYDMSGGKKGGFIVSSHLQGEAVLNWREIFTYISYPKESRDYSRWPEKPEGWRKVTEEYSEKLMGLTVKVVEVLSEAMGLEKEAMVKACGKMEQKIVINFYPPCPQPDLILGVKRHTDPSTVTLLLQDQVSGLQATTDGGNTWATVKPLEGAIVVNLGDHSHYLSNGRFRSADHRAVVNSNCSRLSIATFQNPNSEAMVYPLKVREGEQPLLKEPITFTEMYRRQMVELIRLKKLAEQHHNDKAQENTDIETPSLNKILA